MAAPWVRFTQKNIAKLFLLLAAALLTGVNAVAQQQKRVLFIGNSYTEVNNLPAIVESIAANMGDALSYASNTPGGCTFMQHCTNTSMTYINQGGWDAVVLQEQSQYPSFPQEQVEAEVFPYARQLVEAVYAAAPCAEPMFYMTWGRCDGDASNAPYFPVLATYEGMDSMLYERYTYMASEFDASVCPVGRVWRSLRTNHPAINLYASDGSHPSAEGSYAAACAFYVMLFGGNPANITYDYSLDAATAAIIRQTVGRVVYDSLARWQRVRPQANFTLRISDLYEVELINNSQHADSYLWDYGDGSREIDSTGTPIYCTYMEPGTYDISLIASRHCMSDTMTKTVTLPYNGGISMISDDAVVIAPNPSRGTVTITSCQPIKAITVYDVQGREVYRVEGVAVTGHTVSHLPRGLYTARIQTTHASTTRRIIVL